MDIYAKEVLQQALQQYKGTILFVSHDHDFVQHVADTILDLTPQHLYTYDGTYEAYLYHKKMVVPAAEQHDHEDNDLSSAPKKHVAKETSSHYLMQKQLRALEVKIKRIEKKQEELGVQLASYIYGTAPYENTMVALKEGAAEIKDAYDAWEKIMKEMKS